MECFPCYLLADEVPFLDLRHQTQGYSQHFSVTVMATFLAPDSVRIAISRVENLDRNLLLVPTIPTRGGL